MQEDDNLSFELSMISESLLQSHLHSQEQGDVGASEIQKADCYTMPAKWLLYNSDQKKLQHCFSVGADYLTNDLLL